MNSHKWTSPMHHGHCKLLELDEAQVRWYSNNKSLCTISRKASGDIKSQLRILADLSRANTEVTDEGNNNVKDNT
jgi:hypothetical protein